MQSRTTIVTGSDLVEELAFSAGEFERRLLALRQMMTERELAAFVSFTPENLYYLTGHNSPGYYFYQACVVTHDSPPVNVLRRIEATNTLGHSRYKRAVIYEDRDDPVKLTLELLAELGVASKRVGIEAGSWFVTPNRFAEIEHGIQACGGTAVDATGLPERLRVIKSEEELAWIRAGARVAEAAMRAAIDASRDGTDENMIAAAAVGEQIRSGGEYAGLPPFITSGTRTGLCHATWSGRVVGEGDLLSYELPGVVKRYCAALFRCGTVGRAPEEIVRLSECILETLTGLIDAIRPGRTSDEIHRIHRETFARHGFSELLGHRTGYSVGINYPPDWGEGHIMSIWEGDDRPLEPGMVFHLVPGVLYLSPRAGRLGSYGLVISETVLVTNDGCEVITNFPRELFVV